MTEEFRPIKDYENYYISSCGRVLNTKTGRFLKMNDNGHGYLSVRFRKGGKNYYIHRLVAETFIDNPNNYETVDHINGLKSDNRVENLQWLTQKDNLKRWHREQKTEEQIEHYKIVHRENIKKLHEKQRKPVICLETGKIYKSCMIAGKTLGIDNGSIGKVCQGKQGTVGGLHFRYLLEDNDYE